MSTYLVCHGCKLAVHGDTVDQLFIRSHWSHGVAFTLETVFLSELLARGYVDRDRPGLQPISLKMGEEAAPMSVSSKAMPFGVPVAGESAIDHHRRMIADHRSYVASKSTKRGILGRLGAFLRRRYLISRRWLQSLLERLLSVAFPGA